MEIALKTLAIVIICVIVALVIISILVSQVTGSKSVIDAFLEFLKLETPSPSIS